MKASTRLYLLIVALLASLFLASCSSSSSGSTPPPPVLYTIGGTVTNLASSDSLQLQDNGGNTLNVTANGAFTFSTSLASGTAYDVTVSAQPSTPAQTCGVTNGTGTATGNITSVAVDCGHNEWTWMSGSNAANQPGTYGTEGTPAAGNTPGGRDSLVSWTDTNWNFWLFSGETATGVLNDLWKYSSGQWTWMSGSSAANQWGTYGTEGTAAPGNIPGARWADAGWVDSTGNLWLFGGSGYGSTGGWVGFNDLWKYSGGQWTWMSGSNVGNQGGTYGTQGTGAVGNVPGFRTSATTWTDASGNFWLFGGSGYDSTATGGELNDLWKYSAGQWTWMNGSDLVNQVGAYGSEGTAAPGNVPGARSSAASWTDKAENLWLFGGYGYDSAGTLAQLNDLWEYSAGQWTWISGSNLVGQAGTYGTQGIAAASNVPGSRQSPAAWTDKAGNLWLFGGEVLSAGGAYVNDLWMYSAGEWTWMTGSKVAQEGTYGTQGTWAPGDTPGGRAGPVAWTDAAGSLWMFGGFGPDTSGTYGDLNDLWRYEP